MESDGGAMYFEDQESPDKAATTIENKAIVAAQVVAKEVFDTVFDDRRNKSETWHRDSAAPTPYAKSTQQSTCGTSAQDILEGRVQLSDAQEHNHHPLIFFTTKPYWW
ncbi:hypothetical protein ACFE04_021728 [Oxalis oulophora]